MQLQLHLQLQLQLHYYNSTTLHYIHSNSPHYTTITPHYNINDNYSHNSATLHPTAPQYTTTTSRHDYNYRCIYNNFFNYNYNIKLQLGYSYNYNYIQLQLRYAAPHYIQQLWLRWPLQPLQKTQLQPPFDSAVGSLCHPCITISRLSYSVLSSKLPPPPCAVLLATENNRDKSQSKTRACFWYRGNTCCVTRLFAAPLPCPHLVSLARWCVKNAKSVPKMRGCIPMCLQVCIFSTWLFRLFQTLVDFSCFFKHVCSAHDRVSMSEHTSGEQKGNIVAMAWAKQFVFTTIQTTIDNHEFMTAVSLTNDNDRLWHWHVIVSDASTPSTLGYYVVQFSCYKGVCSECFGPNHIRSVLWWET